MMRVLVTGTGGFLGKVLVDALLRGGYTVRALYHRAGLSPGDSRCEVVPGDVCDRTAMKAAGMACQAVVHWAGKVHVLDELSADEQE